MLLIELSLLHLVHYLKAQDQSGLVQKSTLLHCESSAYDSITLPETKKQ